MSMKCVRAAASLLALVMLFLTASGPLWADDDATQTPIKHVVVIFQENVSFDHYFGTYPHAAPNADGSVYFHAKSGTPSVNNLESAGLLTNNPNGVNPFRMDHAFPNTCDQDHGYGDEQFAFHGGLMDGFGGKKPNGSIFSCNDPHYGQFSVMGYFDGNTVTALWNYAQNFAMSDNHYGTGFGPSTPGLINLLSGNTYGATLEKNSAAGNVSSCGKFCSVIGDPDPFGDMCSAPGRGQIQMAGSPSVGDLLNAANVTWGSFMGGFSSCTVSHIGLTGINAGADYIPHHAFTQYWASTLNANHTPPASDNLIGKSDNISNHEYDLSLFFTALKEHRMPAVSILKAPAYQDGHAGYSDPLDEQFFLVNTINTIMNSEDWGSTAIIITWDDSDGWYDHVMGPIVNQSNAPEDQFLGPGNCGTAKVKDSSGNIENARCGYGPRIPLLVISPYAKRNYVDHSVLDQSSILRFIEDNWSLGRIQGGSTDAVAGSLLGMFDFSDNGNAAPKLILNALTGSAVSDE